MHVSTIAAPWEIVEGVALWEIVEGVALWETAEVLVLVGLVGHIVRA